MPDVKDDGLSKALDEIRQLKDRNLELADRTARLEAVRLLYSQIIGLKGLDNLLNGILHSLMEIYGGKDITIYFRLPESWYSQNIMGVRNKVDIENDPVLKNTLKSRICMQMETGKAGFLGTDHNVIPADELICIFPLVYENEGIGAVRFDGIIVMNDSIITELELVFQYLAMALQNQVHSYSELREAYTELDQIFQSNPDGMMFVNPDKKITRINKALCSMLELPAEELIGSDCWRHISCPLFQNGRCIFDALESNSSYSYELNLKSRSGRTYRCVASGKVITDSAGTVIGAVTNIKDLTAMKQAEEALRQSRLSLENIISGTRVGTWEWNVQTGETVFNEYWATMLGYNLEELSPVSVDTWKRLTHPDDLEKSIKILESHFRRESDIYESEMRMLHKNGGWVWVLARGAVASWTSDGKPHIMFGTHLDITERKKAEEAWLELNHSLEDKVAQSLMEIRERDHIMILQSRQAAMGEMMGNIAHQWRQPITTIGLIMQNLVYHYESGELDLDTLKKKVHNAVGIIEHLSQTIDDFRNYFSKDKEKQVFDLSEPLQSSLSIIDASFHNNGIELCAIINDRPLVYGFKSELSQVLLNLLINAKEALLDRKTQAPRVSVELSRDQDYAVLKITDNAGGIDPDILPKIFEPYFTTKESGTGIGLYMSKMIVEKNMGGRLQVRNIDQGAEFSILIRLDGV